MIWDYVAGLPKAYVLDEFQHACNDCDVRWRDKNRTSNCWVCGSEVSLPGLLPEPLRK